MIDVRDQRGHRSAEALRALDRELRQRHPDYRAEVCFDNATRANLGGLKHWERVFLGLALLHRYRNKREGTRFEHLYALLDAAHQIGAETLGKALRFGAMLWTLKTDRTGPRLSWGAKTKALELRLDSSTSPLYGEVAESRFKSLADTKEAESRELLVGWHPGL